MAITDQQRLEFFLKKIDALPAFPGVVTELVRLIDNPMTSIDKIEKILTTDTGLTVKTLKLANSAYYSIPGGAKTIKRAITFLGMASLKQMVLTSAVFDQLKTSPGSVFDAAQFWKHSFGTAAVSELLSRRLKLGTPEEAFICGLVHDMGKVIFQMYDLPEFERVVFLASSKGLPYEDAEKQLGVPKHGLIGSMMAKKWNLPLTVQSAILDHHNPNVASRLTAIPEVNDTVNIVYLANRIEHVFAALKQNKTAPYSFENDDLIKRLNLKMEDLAKLNPELEQTLNNADSLFRTLF